MFSPVLLGIRISAVNISFGRNRKQSACDYGFSQAQVKYKTCYYLVYRKLVEAMNRKTSRCCVTMDERCVRQVEKKYPFGEVTIFTRDIMSYFKFNNSSKFVALCIDAKGKEKSGYWFNNIDTKPQMEDFCDCLNRLFVWEKEITDNRNQTIQCCCGTDVDIPLIGSSADSGHNGSSKSKSSRWSSPPTRSLSSLRSISFKSQSLSSTGRRLRRV